MVLETGTVFFKAIEIKGGILPSSLLEDIANFQKTKELHLEEIDYDLHEGVRIRDLIDSSWLQTKKLWNQYQNQKNISLKKAGINFSKNFLKEILYWNDIKETNGWIHDEDFYPITHRAFKNTVPLVIKGFEPHKIDQYDHDFSNEGRKRSPQSCLQECLNADDSAEWGLLFCGDQLRLFHDNPSLVKPAYLNIDLELLIEGDLFNEFSVLWLILHASRLRKNENGECFLDQWRIATQKSGERIRGALRLGVENALIILGNGFLNHPSNNVLRNLIYETNTLSSQEFHEQLLRLIYRFLFLFTIEDRELLFPKSIIDENLRANIYMKGYSVSRLRELALKRVNYKGKFGDLWHLQKIVFNQLNIDNSPLGLPGLGGLFSTEQCKDLINCEIYNNLFLKAIKQIAWFRSKESGLLTRVRYRDLDTEELGGVYEGLLELNPQILSNGSNISLSYGNISGNERKLSGSYYTPKSLVQKLINQSLIPVINDRLKKTISKDSIPNEILNIKVIDPACGSGHFLLAAARELALVLAKSRSANDFPNEEERQSAMRDIVANCIYAVDKNPMAVELCKVALWIEAVEPGKPLSFLDAHIQCGDALVGILDKKITKNFIPSEAYKPLFGDVKMVCNSLKKENDEICRTMNIKNLNKTIQGSLDLDKKELKISNNKALQIVEAMPEKTFADLCLKQEAYSSYLEEKGQSSESLAADLFTAAFFLPKTIESRNIIPTTEHLLRVIDGNPIPDLMEKAILETAKKFGFFHWHLRFGEILDNGGFDCILGNPPWDKVKVLDKEFFEKYIPSISSEKNKNSRMKMIENLIKSDNRLEIEIFKKYEEAKSYAAYLSGFVKKSQRYKLAVQGEINLYTAFCETSINLKKNNSSIGIVLPSGIFADKTNEEFAKYFILSGELRYLADFINKKNIFEGVGSNVQFCLLTLSKLGKDSFRLACRLQSTEGIKNAYEIRASEIKLFNPNTLHIPAISTAAHKEIISKIYNNSAHLLSKTSFGKISGWEVEFNRMFDMTIDAGIFYKERDLEINSELKFNKDWTIESQNEKFLPLFEGKLIDSYNHRASSFEGIDERNIYGTKPKTILSSLKDIMDFSWHPKPRYWIKENIVKKRIPKKWKSPWLISFRNTISSGADTRSLRLSLIPVFGAGNSLPIIYEYSGGDYPLVLIGILNSIIIDFVVKQKVSGANLNYYIMEQLPIPYKENLTKEDIEFISSRVKGLSYTSSAITKSATEIIKDESSFKPILNELKRAEAKAEIDVYTARLFGLTRSEMSFILDDETKESEHYSETTFAALKSVELKEFGEYRTKRLVLEAWDKLF